MKPSQPRAALPARSRAVNAMSATFEILVDRAGEWRWRLRHANGRVIADSGEGYTTRENCLNGIESVKTNAPGAPLVEIGKSVTPTGAATGQTKSV